MRLLIAFLITSAFSFSVQAQSTVWAQKAQANSAGSAFGQAVTTDPQGNVIVTGTFSGTITLGQSGNTKSFTSAGNYDIFLAKYTCEGNLLWAVSIGGTGEDRSTWDRMGVSVHPSGYIFVVGSYTGTCTFGNYTGSPLSRSSNSSKHFFLACYNSSGTIRWVQNTNGTSLEQGHNVLVAADGKVYVTGNCAGNSVLFYTTPGGSTQSYNTNFYEDIFIARYDTAGTLYWVRTAGSAQSEGAVSLACDNQSNLYITGAFGYNGSSGTFGPFTLANSGGWGAYLAKLDINGNWVWAKSVGGVNHELGIDLMISGDRIYWLGIFTGSTTINFPPSASVALTSKGGQDIFLSKLDTSGQLIHAHNIGSTGTDEGERIVKGDNGDIYVSGLFQNQVQIGWGTDTLLRTSAGGYDVFLARYNSSTMKPVEAMRAGGASDDVSRGFWYEPGIQQLYGTGYFYGNSVWGNTTLTNSASGGDMFLARVGKNLYASISLAIAGSKSILCPNDSSVLSVTTPSAIHAYQWYRNGTVIPGATGTSYTTKLGGSFKVVANLCGQIDNSPAFGVTEMMSAVHIQTLVTKICEGDSVSLGAFASGATQFSWTPVAGINQPNSSQIVAKPSATTTYSVLAANGLCQSRDSIQITVIPKPIVSVSHDSICEGDSVFLTTTAAGASSFAWTPAANVSAPTQSQTWAQPYVTTQFSVTVTNSSCLFKDSVRVTVTQKVKASSSHDTICAGDSVLLNAVQNGAAYFSWTPAASISQPAQAQTWARPDVNTIYSVATSGSSCPSSASVSVIVIPTGVIATASRDTICAGDSVLLTAASPGSPSFDWTPATGVSNPGLQQTYATPPNDSWYTVTAQNSQCKAKDSVHITVIPLTQASFSYTATGFLFTFNNLSQNALGYLWDFGDGNSSGIANPAYTYAAPGTYRVNLVAFGICGNDTDTSTLVILPGSAEQLIAQHGVFVYPNPAQRQLHVTSVHGNLQAVCIYSIAGAQLLQQPIGGNDVLLTLPELASGSYLLDVSTTDGSHLRQRLIIQ